MPPASSNVYSSGVDLTAGLRLLLACGRDADDLRPRLEFVEVAGADVADATPQAAGELADHLVHRLLQRRHSLNPLGHVLVERLFAPIEAEACLGGLARRHASVDLVAAAAPAEDPGRGLPRGGGE